MATQATNLIAHDGFDVTACAREGYRFLRRHWPPQPDERVYFDGVADDLIETLQALTAGYENNKLAVAMLSGFTRVLELEWLSVYDDECRKQEALEAQAMRPATYTAGCSPP